MIEFLNNVSPILLAFIATLFTYSVTAIGAALVFIFKKINKKSEVKVQILIMQKTNAYG